MKMTEIISEFRDELRVNNERLRIAKKEAGTNSCAHKK